MVILVPAYEPDERLVALVRAIRDVDPWQPIVVVDDGSGAAYAPVFAACRRLGADVIGHLPNRGKGFALRRGFAHVAERYPGLHVVCADCDGQHTLADIARVARAVHEHPDGVVLGARQFVGDVPAKSRFGNDLTRSVFGAVTGLRLQDTQTGLRGYPASLLPWLQRVHGDRFEYELRALLDAKRDGIALHEVPIETIYLDGNSSSHFRPVRDSVRVYVPFLRFGLSSLTAFALDATLFFVIMAMSGWLLAAVVLARLVSGAVNYLANHHLVFRSGRSHAHSARRYVTLAASLLAANYALIAALTGLGVGLVAAKFATEATLFVASYQIQRRVVFATP